MKFVLTLLTASFLVACAPSIKRAGYPKAERRDANCPVAFARQGSSLDNDQKAVSLGIVEVKDGGFSMSCTEGDMLQLVRAEVCSQGGNAALILDEKQPDIWSTCYRVKAEIMSVHPDSVAVRTEARFAPEAIAKRSAGNSAAQMGILVGSVVAGAVLGFVLVQ
jgi:hypothetical protein